MEFTDKIQRILKEANASKNKGNYVTYSHYERLIAEESLTVQEFESAVKQLKSILRV